jgi:hypothetical protein
MITSSPTLNVIWAALIRGKSVSAGRHPGPGRSGLEPPMALPEV